MRKTKSTIEINGQRYDAASGRALTPGAAPLHAGTKPSRRHTAHRQVLQHQPHPTAASKTLMRQTVTKPRGPASVSAAKPFLAAVTVKRSVQRLDEQRWQHAKHVRQSHLISHFSAIDPTTFTPSLPAPAKQAAIPVRPGKQPKQPPTKDELLERALKHAKSHEQPPPPRPRRQLAKRKLGVRSAAAASVVLLAVVAVHNLPGARFQVAAARAGFSAGLPDYQPAGYSLGQLHYSSGVVAAQFQGKSGQYTLVQQRSSWNDSALVSNFVAPRDPNYQTAAGGGRTVYLYNRADATWVNGGVWYVIQSNGSLSQQQLLNLASSL